MTLYRNVTPVPVDLPDGRVLGPGDDVDLPGVSGGLQGRLTEVQTAPDAPAEESAEPATADEPGEPEKAVPAKKTVHHRSKS